MTDRAPGFALDDGGSLTIYLQHESPAAEAESNWLPAPEGPVSLQAHLY